MKSKRLVKRLLIIAYVFPPIPYGGTYRTIRLCKRMDNMGIKVHVLTINQYEDIPNDYELLAQIPKSIIVHRTSTLDPWRRYQSWKKRFNIIPGFRHINKIALILLRLISVPDHMNFWVPFATLEGLKIIRDHSINVIYVSSPPNSSQLIGYFLKKLTKVEWVADFRDPIVGNIAEVNLIKPSELLSKIEKWIRIKFETLIVRNADKIIANTSTHKRELSEKFKVYTVKFHVIRNSFDENDYKRIDGSRYKKFTIAHVGSMYGMRKPDVLFGAIRDLEKEISPEALNIQILFVGLNDGRLEESIINSGVSKYVKIYGIVPHREAIKIMMKSHLLLLIKATGEGSYGQIPGKFYEYLGSKNKILCLGPNKSEVAEIMSELKVGPIIENDEKKLLEFLREEYMNFLIGDVVRLKSPKIDDFNSKRMAQSLISLLNAL